MPELAPWEAVELGKKIYRVNFDDSENLENLIETKRFLLTKELADIGTAPTQSLLNLQLGKALLMDFGTEQAENSIYFPFNCHDVRTFTD